MKFILKMFCLVTVAMLLLPMLIMGTLQLGIGAFLAFLGNEVGLPPVRGLD